MSEDHPRDRFDLVPDAAAETAFLDAWARGRLHHAWLLCGVEGKPLLYGGTGSMSRLQDMPPDLPDRLEPGTHNMPGIAGLLEGIRFVRRQGVESIAAREAGHEERRLAATPGADLHGRPTKRDRRQIGRFTGEG